MRSKSRPGGKSSADDGTRNRLLDAAEQLFAERGYDGASVRDINDIARVNSGAIHYHFGTKDDLFRAVVDRRGSILSEDRLARLADCAEGPHRPPLIEQIIAAYIIPYANPALGTRQERLRFARLRARLIADSRSGSDALPLGPRHEETGRAFVDALGRAMPNLAPEELRLRYLVMWSALNTLSAGLGSPALWRRSGSAQADPIAEFESMIPRLIALISAMFRAPAAAAGTVSPKDSARRTERARRTRGQSARRISA